MTDIKCGGCGDTDVEKHGRGFMCGGCDAILDHNGVVTQNPKFKVGDDRSAFDVHKRVTPGDKP